MRSGPAKDITIDIHTMAQEFYHALPVMADGEVELSGDSDLMAFFKKADKALGFSRKKVFRLALKMKIQPTILLKGYVGRAYCLRMKLMSIISYSMDVQGEER